MDTAFQSDAFQTDAFQVAAETPTNSGNQRTYRSRRRRVIPTPLLPLIDPQDEDDVLAALLA